MAEAFRTASGPRIPSGERVYAIGDIHGRADLLARLTEKIEADRRRSSPGKTTIVYLGDLVDRGPETSAVLDALTAPPPDGIRRIILKGNHEAMMLRFLASPDAAASWLKLGGFETIASYGLDGPAIHRAAGAAGLAAAFAEIIPASHKALLESLASSAVIGDYYFCHAGVDPALPLERQQDDDLLWIRDRFLKSRVRFGKMIVHGHTPVARPELHPNRIAIDTEAYRTGRLTSLVLDGAEQRILST